MDRTSKILVVGDLWTGPVFAHSLLAHGLTSELWVSDGPSVDGPEPLYVGNGETREKAGLIYGEPMAREIWAISEASQSRARALFKEKGVPVFDKGLVRLPAGVSEPAFSFSASTLAKALGIPLAGRFKKIESIRSHGPLDFEITLQTQKGSQSPQAAFAVITSESFEGAAVPWLADKRLPITLSSFVFPPSAEFDHAFALLNGGADFAVADESHLRLGSFRNLFEDRGFGLHSVVDKKTKENVLAFFSAKKWIDPAAMLSEGFRYESVSCDGLPIVGTVPGMPNVIFATAFAARTACFAFEVADRVARAIAHGGESDLGLFNTRRLL